MTKPETIAKKRSGTHKIVSMVLPDPETRAFWALTTDDPHEYAGRVTRFSRSVGSKPTRNAIQPSERRWRDAAIAARSEHGLGKMLLMPTPSVLSSASSRPAGLLRRVDQFLNCSGMQSRISSSVGKTRKSSKGDDMKAPGVRARKRGTKLKRGAATQVVVYPRQKTKGVLVQASRDISRPLSSFLILAGLKEAAALRGCEIKNLIPADELEQYRKSRVYGKRNNGGK